MRFIPKKTITEGMASNPLDHQMDTDNDVTTIAQEGLLTAVAAETDAINQYIQIADLIFKSENWLKELVGDQIEDIISEEKKHLAQLSNIVSKLPNMSEKWEEGWKEAESGEDKSDYSESNEEQNEQEESSDEKIEEAVEENRLYSDDAISDLMSDLYGLTDEQYHYIYSTLRQYSNDGELTPNEVNSALDIICDEFKFTEEERLDLEEKVGQTINPKQERINEFNEAKQYDINALNELLEKDNEKISTKAAAYCIKEAIDKISQFKYNGDKSLDWKY